MSQIDVEDDGFVRLPKWQLAVVMAILAAAIPWVTWTTVALSQLDVKVGILAERGSSAVERRLSVIEGKVDSLQYALDRLEKK